MLKVFSILPKSKDSDNQMVLVCKPADFVAGSGVIVDKNNKNNTFSSIGSIKHEYGVLILKSGNTSIGQELNAQLLDGELDANKPLKRAVVAI